MSQLVTFHRQMRHFVEAGSPLGTPTIHPAGTELTDDATGATWTVPDGSQFWVWENIADLPPGATIDTSFTVRPDAGIFPVGSADLGIDVAAYTSDDETLLPAFPGSSSVATDSGHTSNPGTADETTPVEALRIHKSEPSPESELLRGVHLNSTTYTLRVEYTGEGMATPVTVTDYLPAGLEYLGGGGVDNTEGEEYPGSGGLEGTPAPDGGGYLAEDSVETVELSDAEAAALGLGEGAGGVYTQVTWTLPEDLTGGTAQDWDAAAGEPGEYIIRYRAGIPLFENTLDFDGQTPDPGSSDQAANLDNNNGPSTRHGTGSEDHIDAQSLRNAAAVEGEYQGALAAGAEPQRTDADTEVVDAVDLRILKSVGPDEFIQGMIGTYTLDLATSEYTSAEDIVITDVIDNGICPVLPEQDGDVTFQLIDGGAITEVDLEEWNGAVAPECTYPSDEGEADLEGATLSGLLFNQDDGSFQLTLAVDDMGAADDAQITYTARGSSSYAPTDNRGGPTSSGDSVGNYVEVQATTHTIEALDGIEGADGPETVWEDSEAVVPSAYTQITKSVLERDAGDPLEAGEESWAGSAEASFITGDDVWYRLTVAFPESVDTRNPVVTDFLPQGVELREDAEILYSPDDVPIENTVVDGNRLLWELGETRDGSEDRFIARGTELEIYLPATVVGMSASADAVDMPQNLMKYQQENSDGEVYFLRDDATIELDYGMTLVKGVAEVDGETGRDARSEENDDGGVFGSDRDGIQVVQGEVVTYRLDVTTPPFPSSDLQVWDLLPQDIAAADVPDNFRVEIDGESSTAFTAEVLDPGDDGYPPVGSEQDERSVISWTLSGDLEPDAEVTMLYDVTIPEGVLVESELDNTAGIAAYDALTNQTGDQSVTYVPQGPFERPVGEEEFGVPGGDTYDDSAVYLPSPTIEKGFVDSEVAPQDSDPVDANNGADQIVQGEHATFEYSVTLPANTTVSGGGLHDTGIFGFAGGTVDYQPVSAEVDYPEGADPDEFTFDEESGGLTFPENYTTGGQDETFTVTLTAWVTDVDASNPDRSPDLVHGEDLENTAQFTYHLTDGMEETLQDTASVTYIEPDVQVAKSADPATDLQIGTEVTYTVAVTNSADRPIAYDNTVVDTVPQGLEVDEESIDGDGVWNAEDRTITWQVAQVPAADGEPISFTYTAVIDELAAGGQDYLNTVDVTGYTLPDTPGTDRTERRGDRTATDEATVTTIDAGIAKGVRIAETDADFTDATTVPIGQTVEYQVEVALHPQVNYWDAVITDTLPAGVTIDETSVTGPAETTDTGTIDGDWTLAVDGDVATWTYDGDIASHADERTLLLTYEALVSDDVAAADLPNTAAFTWNRTNDDEETREGVEDDATLTLLHPELVIDKTVNELPADAVELGEAFDYDLRVTNTGDTAGYNLVVTDQVPAGVVVDEDTISDGGLLTGADPVTGGGTITWDNSADGGEALHGPLYHADSDDDPQSLTLSYAATLAGSAELGAEDEFINTAQVGQWESFEDGGRSYGPSDPATAEVTTAFPYLTLDKVPTGTDIAYAGEQFSWTLRATNTGDGAAYLVELTDTLPANWTFDETDLVTVAGSDIDDDYEFVTDGSGEGDERQVLTWTVDGAGEPVLDPGEAIEVTFTATPSEAALDEAGVGGDVAHTNTLTARAEDPTGSDGNADGPYSDPEDPADAFIHAADLALTKTAASEPIVAGTDSSTGWTIEVTNNGEDTAVGPFTVSDTTGELPEGLTITEVSGEGWTSTSIERGEDGVTTFDVTRADTDETLGAGESFPPIEVLVSVAPDVQPVEVDNTAVVTSDGTHDPEPTNNDDEDPLPITTVADLAIEKVLNTEEPNAGEAITWQLNPRNLGPSVSASTAEEPITITDEIPEGITEVTEDRVDGGEDWTVTASGGFPASGGDTITFTYTGDVLAVGSAGPVTLTGTISPSWAAGDELANTAIIEPGATEDPKEENNTSTVTTEPGTETALNVTKTRQDTEVPVVPGEPVSYVITVANTGPADAQDVTVVDELPDYLSYVSYGGVDGTWTRTDGPDEGDQHFTLTDPNPLIPGESMSFVLTAQVDSAYNDEVINWVEASATNVPEDPRDSDDSSSDRQANLAITKTHEGDAVAGESLDYVLTATNEGPSTSSGPITVTDELPAGFSYAPGSAQVSVAGGPATGVEPEINGQELTWPAVGAESELAAGDTIVITFTTTIADSAPAQTDLVNVAEVDGPEDTDPSDNRDEDPTNVTTHADMTIIKDVADGPWIAGTEVEYTFTVTNAGPSVAHAQVTDVWPTGMTGISISGEGWECEDGTCTYPGHPVDETTLTVTGLIDQAVEPDTELENIAELTWTDSRGSHDDEDPETIEVDTEADLALAKTAVDADGEPITEATAGEQARYLLEVTNHGPSLAAAPITVTDTLPDGMSYVGLAGDSRWELEERDGQDLTFVLDEGETALAAGASAPEVTVIVHLDAGLPATDDDEGIEPLVNDATVTSSTEDPDPTNNDDEEPLEIQQSADLAVTKSHQGPAAIGEDLTFDVVVTNNGPSTADQVTVTETIPAGLDYAGYEGSDQAWSQTGEAEPNENGTTTVEFTLDGELAAPGQDGEPVQAPQLLVTTTVTAQAYPEVTNVVVVDGEQPDPNPGNNDDENPVPVQPLADLEIVKELDGDTLAVGETADYTLTVTNHGPTEHLGQIDITDELPTGLLATDAGGTEGAAGIECEITDEGAQVDCVTGDTLAVGESLHIAVTVEVLASAWTAENPEVTNTATVTGTSEDPDPENNTSTVTTPVQPDVQLELEKTRGAVDGVAVNWTITVSSVGRNDAVDGAVVVDDLPAELRLDGVTSEVDVTCAAGDADHRECVVPGPIATGESVSFTLHTTTSQAEGTTVVNAAWLIDPETGEMIPDTEDSAEHSTPAPAPGDDPEETGDGTPADPDSSDRPGLSVTGVSAGLLILLALLALVLGSVLTARARARRTGTG